MRSLSLQPDGTERTPEALRSYHVFKTLLEMGPGPHPMRRIVERTGLPRGVVRRRLNAMREAGLCCPTPEFPGHHELTTAVLGADSQHLLHALPGVQSRSRQYLSALQQQTGQIVFMHGHMLLDSPVRLCVECRGDSRPDFARDLAAHPTAAGRLRQAPLAADAPGLVILAHLDDNVSLSSQLRTIRALGYAISGSPLPGWSFVSVPVHAGPEIVGLEGLLGGARVVGAVSLLARTDDLERHVEAWLSPLRHGGRSLPASTTRPETDAHTAGLRAA
ncbi:IclR family transcriptional regulator [Streptomyces chartreusis]|uniref:hypothetical protein n=1 Tax=Streptomyces chartreusis TaxID=1969 RepID=UPI00381B2DFC